MSHTGLLVQDKKFGFHSKCNGKPSKVFRRKMVDPACVVRLLLLQRRTIEGAWKEGEQSGDGCHKSGKKQMVAQPQQTSVF